MDKGKIFTVVLWVFLAINYSISFSMWINYFAILLLAIHLIEYLFFFKKIRLSGDSVISGFMKTLIFGVLYIGNIEDKESS